MKVTFVDAKGRESHVETASGRSLMQAAVAANVAGIEAECGGMMTCGTCHVYVREPYFSALPAATGEEKDLLSFTGSEPRECSRLSCQIQLVPELDGLVVDLPASQY
jgi:ferredoxin, 2Fe-2S